MIQQQAYYIQYIQFTSNTHADSRRVTNDSFSHYYLQYTCTTNLHLALRKILNATAYNVYSKKPSFA